MPVSTWPVSSRSRSGAGTGEPALGPGRRKATLTFEPGFGYCHETNRLAYNDGIFQQLARPQDMVRYEAPIKLRRNTRLLAVAAYDPNGGKTFSTSVEVGG